MGRGADTNCQVVDRRRACHRGRQTFSSPPSTRGAAKPAGGCAASSRRARPRTVLDGKLKQGASQPSAVKAKSKLAMGRGPGTTNPALPAMNNARRRKIALRRSHPQLWAGRAEAHENRSGMCGTSSSAAGMPCCPDKREWQRLKYVDSVSVPFSENLQDRLDQDQQVEPEAPIINITQIEFSRARRYARRSVWHPERRCIAPNLLFRA